MSGYACKLYSRPWGVSLFLNSYFLHKIKFKNRLTRAISAMLPHRRGCYIYLKVCPFSSLQNMASRGPVIVRMHNSGTYNAGGVSCCCCRCCTCINLQYLKTQPGIYKLGQAILGSFCQTLALEYGMAYSGSMGASYYGFLTTSSWCVMTTILLLVCYCLSEKSVNLVRQSLFETIFNSVAAFCYLSSTSYLGYIVNTILFPLFKSTAYFQAYPAMTGAYLLGTVVGILHGVDAYRSYKYYKGFR